MKIAVIDYGAGNLLSVTKALDYLGIDNEIAREPAALEAASGMILPGVGAFPKCMQALESSGMAEGILRQVEKKPLLGICLGMQMLLGDSEEISLTRGLGLIPGHVVSIPTALKLPHIGWNSILRTQISPLLRGVPEGSFFYFVHSFCAAPSRREDLLAVTEYGTEVAAVVGHGNAYGCQFHPEKSGPVGLQILKNFGELCQ